MGRLSAFAESRGVKSGVAATFRKSEVLLGLDKRL